MAENVAMAVDWFVSALSRLFDGDEPFQNQNFLRLCCMFFASPLYENNARLVQRHLVKRTYAELSIEATDYEPTLWLLLAFLHLITEFQTDTYGLCRDTGLFPLLARAVRGAPEKHLHVLAMSLMFEIAQAVTLSPTDIDCVTDDTLLYLLDYVERMRYAESDVYNNTGTKLLLALNEQFLKHDGYQSIPQSPLVFNNAGKAQRGLSGARPDSLISTYSLPPPESSPGMSLRTDDTERPQSHAGRVSERSRHSRAESIDIAMASNACGHSGIDGTAQRPLRHPAVQSIPQEVPVLSRSRSMDLRAQLEAEDGSLIRSASETRDQTVQRVGLRTARTSIASSTTLCRRSSSGHSTPVVELLAQRIDCCKTFTENLVFLLNRETEPSTQVLILHMLYCILTDPSTSCILYTNDMFVLIDIVIRDLANLSDGLPKQRQAYLLVTSAILRNSVYLTTRHRLSDIELCLVNLLRHSLVSSHASASEKHESHAEPPLPPPSMRHFSTPRLSTASDLSIGVPEVKSRRGSGISSPVSSFVSKYKRSHRAQPPPVPTSTPAGAPARMDQDEIPKLVVPISPVIESFSETAPTIVHRPSMDLESDDASETEDPKGVVPDTAEERRATRKLVESALRCCHEARVVAATKSLSQQSI
ncbi:pre-rRNA processing [Linderina pennispora]|nr:pre-rRNA processing [Linderina pennispora]